MKTIIVEYWSKNHGSYIIKKKVNLTFNWMEHYVIFCAYAVKKRNVYPPNIMLSRQRFSHSFKIH